jgi:hypothetical protein
MKIQLLSILIVLSASFSAVMAQTTQADVIPNQTMTGKIMCGYQGWFNAPGDGANLGWKHAGSKPGEVNFDLWPDVSELDADERFATEFKHKDGSVAELFSSYKEKTVLRHFKWMRDYGLDGVFLQRFTSQFRDPARKNHVDTVLAHVRKGAAEYGRVYGLMYDLSGLKAGDIQSVIDDWKGLVDSTHLTSDDRYVRHHGKPVVVLWGLGFNGKRNSLVADGLAMVEFLKNDPIYGGNTVMIGVPTQWREEDLKSPEFHKLLLAADIIQPWAVGSVNTPEQVVEKAATVWAPDMEWCRANGREYMPVVFPGFSWFNLRKGTKPSNQIPRLGGRLLWTQYLEAKKLGATMVYQAMFDEIDEGTAIFKVTNDVPDGEGKSQFVPLEGLPSDFYLKLVGQAGRLIRGEISAEDDQLVKNAKWIPFVPALPTTEPDTAPTKASGRIMGERRP